MRPAGEANEHDFAAAWLVRGGRDGEREESALREGILIAGWDEVDDISHCATKEQLREKLRESYPEQSKGTVSNWTGQLWRILSEIEIGDLVVLPMKTSSKVAIGKIYGSYYYDAEREPGFRHLRAVKWIRTEISRTAIQQDLLDSMGSLMTVCRLQRYGAARRIAYIADHGIDPGPTQEEMPQQGVRTLRELVEKVDKSDQKEPFLLTVRELLKVWGFARRSSLNVDQIESDLIESGLTTRPPFTEEWIDNEIEILPVGQEPGEAENETRDQVPQDVRDASDFPAITWRIGMLEPANKGVAAVYPKDSLSMAMTAMIADNYSQVAVIDDKGKLHGAVSWESIGKAKISRSATLVEQVMENAREVAHNEDLLSQVDEIYRSGYVFVCDSDKKITGIVTAADLTSQFRNLAQPFLLVEEVERRLRRRVDEVFSSDTLKEFVPKHLKNKMTSAADMTLGNYERLLAVFENWEYLDWPLDHELFMDRLRRVRLIRNDLMHFNPDPLNPEELNHLESIVRMLRAVDPRG
ncbi:restriction system protein [Actinopolyspora alba]|uniref:Restriction system protein n=1 Tax=Actinopolyspora alba TaxID=673379 RepID=A0A1I2C120_9ACTN|nr:CBS domain-containing protein [Actinopolyspora alba]SFE61260.1 restriction system protein [Actinopolyspora alba]